MQEIADIAKTESERVTLTEQEFCTRVGISRTTAWQMRQNGKLPHFKVGTRILYSPRHVEQFLLAFERNTKPKRSILEKTRAR
jgi:excisionase family DNA binding protein